nr:replication protein a 14 kda subunit a [Quercus suber]
MLNDKDWGICNHWLGFNPPNSKNDNLFPLHTIGLLWRRDLYEREEESLGGVADGLFGIVEALNDGGDEGGVEVELEMVVGEDGGAVQSLERTLGDFEVVVRGEIWRRDLYEREEESLGGVTDGLFSIVEALNDGGDEGGVEVELEMVVREDGGAVQSLERTLGDSEVVVRGEITDTNSLYPSDSLPLEQAIIGYGYIKPFCFCQCRVVAHAYEQQLIVKGLPHVSLMSYVEVIGIAESDQSIRTETWTNFGNTFDTQSYNQVCQLANGEFKGLFL